MPDTPHTRQTSPPEGAQTAPPAQSPPAVDPVRPDLGGQTLSAPWRLEYIQTVPGEAGGDGGTCFLREYWLTPENDGRNHVVARTAEGLILLNAYPYAGGHLLAALGEARGRLLEYTAGQRAALWGLTDLAAALMEETLHPQGINIGVNQGRAAGAGVPQHLHVHLVPRWGGDVNFMTAVGRVRVIPASLEVMAERYRRVWEGMRK